MYSIMYYREKKKEEERLNMWETLDDFRKQYELEKTASPNE